ncbi:hypothetical protein Bhyg_06254, partial [Pseudolycoriella hygida]
RLGNLFQKKRLISIKSVNRTQLTRLVLSLLVPDFYQTMTKIEASLLEVLKEGPARLMVSMTDSPEELQNDLGNR